jgi:phosphoribosylformylglycinamidine synthase subunit PurS
MKAHVYVTLKTSVLDPQGQTIHNACARSDLPMSPPCARASTSRFRSPTGLTADAARAQVERIAREVLTNPVIEEYTYRIEE